METSSSRVFFGMVTTAASRPYTHAALKSFATATPLAAEDRFFLIDNDGAWDAPLPGALPGEVLRNPAPRSFAENANQMVDRALDSRADLFFLNNDVIFTKGWRAAQGESDESITSPLSNREVQYAETVVNPRTQAIARMFITSVPMSLEDYAGKEHALHSIAEAHAAQYGGFWRVFALPFFCVRIPLGVLEAAGHFDVTFGTGGGEDFDYCLRSYLAGFDVQFALGAYVLHFYGKSTWSGAEDEAQRQSREQRFMARFKEKWGQSLHDIFLREDAAPLAESGLADRPNTREQLQSSILKLLEGREVTVKIG